MNDFQAIAVRVEIEALRGEFTDAVRMRDYDRIAAMFTADGAWRMPGIPAEVHDREQIRAWGRRAPGSSTSSSRTPTPASSRSTATPPPGARTCPRSGAVPTADRR